MPAIAMAKDVFAVRHIGADQLPAVSVTALPIDEGAKRSGRRLSKRGLALLSLACSTQPTFCSVICGCVRTSR
jgi:hypothetical protein